MRNNYQRGQRVYGGGSDGTEEAPTTEHLPTVEAEDESGTEISNHQFSVFILY